MKYYKRLNMYKASNVSFNPATCEAFSYGWWRFVAIIEGKVIFNNYRYSSSTTGHQYKVRRLLENLNIKIDIEMPLPKGIRDESLESLILESEESLCDWFLYDMAKRDDKNEKAREKRRLAKELTYKEVKQSSQVIEKPTLSLVSQND